MTRNLIKKLLILSACLQQSATCLAIICPPLDPPENGRFTSLLEQGYGSIVPIACDKGYFLIGESILQCVDINNDGIGDWNNSVPVCKRKHLKEWIFLRANQS